MATRKFSLSKAIDVRRGMTQEISGIYKHDVVKHKLTMRETNELISARIYNTEAFKRLPVWAQNQITGHVSGCHDMLDLFTEFKYTVKIDENVYFGTTHELVAQGLDHCQISTYHVKAGTYWQGTDKEWFIGKD